MTEPLADLVRRRHATRSYRDMSETARKAGHTISHSQLQAIAQDAISKPPLPEQVAAIAAAIDLPYEHVRAATLQQFYGHVPAGMAPEEEPMNEPRIETWSVYRVDFVATRADQRLKAGERTFFEASSIQEILEKLDVRDVDPASATVTRTDYKRIASGPFEVRL